MRNAFILCLLVVLEFKPSIGNDVDVEEEPSNPLNIYEQLGDAAPGSVDNEFEEIKRAGVRGMLGQHALRLKRGNLGSFAHALRVRRAGVGQRSSWGHALRVRSAMNRGHALRIKKGGNGGDYRAFALRVKKDDSAIGEDQDPNAEMMIPGVEDESLYSWDGPGNEGLRFGRSSDPQSEAGDQDVGQYREKKSPMRYD